VSLDTSAPAPRESLEEGQGEQYGWLRSRLEGAQDDPDVDWIVVFTHRPLYSHGVGPGAHGSYEELRETLAPLFQEAGVDLVLQGHDHHYERSRPLLHGRPTAAGCGPVYMVTGGGGGSRSGRRVEASPLTAHTSRAHHFLRLVIGEDEIRGRALGRDGEPVDRFEIRPYDPGEAARAERCAVAAAAAADATGAPAAGEPSEGPDRTARSDVRFRAMPGLRPVPRARSLQDAMSAQDATSAGGPEP
jgi:hypothetical protein